MKDWQRRLPPQQAGQRFNLNEQEKRFMQENSKSLAKLDMSMKQLQDMLRGIDHLDELPELPQLKDVCWDDKRLRDDLMGLWNYTSREEFDGRRPYELHLRKIIVNCAALDSLSSSYDPETKHYECNHTSELLSNPDYFSDKFLAFVDSKLGEQGGQNSRFGGRSGQSKYF